MRKFIIPIILLLLVGVSSALDVKPKWSYGTGDYVWSVAISSDGEYVVAGSKDDKVYFFDRSGKLLWSYETGGDVWSVAISSDGKYVVAGSGDSKVYFFDRSGKLLWSYDTDDWVESVAITPDR
ncbi:hypothetical protein DRP04_10915 [Archaeoglobales archaeon]|nr:MAG: hypothetical protein DRP04_10915 [Archaeoglobales archaeon]